MIFDRRVDVAEHFLQEELNENRNLADWNIVQIPSGHFKLTRNTGKFTRAPLASGFDCEHVIQ